MPRVIETDPVLDLVKRTVLQYGLQSEGPMGQQILLLGETFYGYRFTSKEFTAVWSASDQTLNVFDRNGKQLGMSFLNVVVERGFSNQSIQFSDSIGGRRIA